VFLDFVFHDVFISKNGRMENTVVVVKMSLFNLCMCEVTCKYDDILSL